MGSFPKIKGYLSLGVVIIRILLFRCYLRVPYFRKLPNGFLSNAVTTVDGQNPALPIIRNIP